MDKQSIETLKLDNDTTWLITREDVMAEIYLKMMDMKSIETLQLDDNANWPDSIFSFCYIHHPILKDCL